MKSSILSVILPAALAQDWTTSFTSVEENAGYSQDGIYTIETFFDNYEQKKLKVAMTIRSPKLENSQVYQSYIQIKDPDNDFEDFVCAIKYDHAMFDRVNQTVLWKNNYCGTKFLGDITTGTQTDVRDEEGEECEAWVVDYEECHTHDDTPENEYVTCVAERTLESPYSRFTLKEGTAYEWYVGYNVFKNHASDERMSFGVSDKMELLLAEQKGVVMAVSASLIYLLFELF